MRGAHLQVLLGTSGCYSSVWHPHNHMSFVLTLRALCGMEKERVTSKIKEQGKMIKHHTPALAGAGTIRRLFFPHSQTLHGHQD